jgi:hypothetical protein
MSLFHRIQLWYLTADKVDRVTFWLAPVVVVIVVSVGVYLPVEWWR